PMGGGTSPASVASGRGSGLREDGEIRQELGEATKEANCAIRTNKTNGTTEDKHSIKYANVKVLLCFFLSEATAIPEQINNAGGDDAVDVQNEVWFLQIKTGR